MLERYMRRKDGARADIEQWLGFKPDIKDPSIDINDHSKLKYQFYKIYNEICGVHKCDQSAVYAYIKELKNDSDNFDSTDLIYYQPILTFLVCVLFK